jgi:hypothetical protein
VKNDGADRVSMQQISVACLTWVLFWGGGIVGAQSPGAVPLKQMDCSGLVLDMRGRPVSGAEVFCTEALSRYVEGQCPWGTRRTAVSREDGRFSLKLPVECKDYIWAFAWKKGLAVGWGRVPDVGSGLDWVVRLSEPTVLAGVIVDENGKGISGATVGLSLNVDWAQGPLGCLPEHPQWGPVRTDEQGRFRFDCIPVGATADFWVEAPGKASCWTSWEREQELGASPGIQFRTGRTDIRIVLSPEAIIRGKVVDSDGGKGVGDIRLLARPNARYSTSFCVSPIMSGMDGTFVYRGLAAKDYSLQIVAPLGRTAEWVGTDVKVTATAGQTLSVDMPVDRGGLIEVSVLDSATARPIGNAAVSITREPNFGRSYCWFHTVYTDEAGRASLRSPAGECELSVSADDYVDFSDSGQVTIVKGGVVRRQVKLDHFPVVVGKIRDTQGRPAVGVVVKSSPVCAEPVLTDGQGRFRVTWRPYDDSEGTVVLARDTVRNLAGLAEVKDLSRPIDITLAPALVVRGRVCDPDGRGILGASLSLRASMGPWSGSMAPAVWTDASGVYQIAAVVPAQNGFRHKMSVVAQGYGPTEIRELSFDAAKDGRLEVETIVMSPADRTVSGVVVDANGATAGGIPIYVLGRGQPSHQTISDGQGRFTVAGVCAGPLRIQAGRPGRPGGIGKLEAHGGDRDVRVVLGSTAVHSDATSLVGRPMPNLNTLGLHVADANDKLLLVCLVNMEQRPSRQCLVELTKRADFLEAKGVRLVVVEVSTADLKQYEDWLKANQVTLAVHKAEGDSEAKKAAWGVKALPWLILTSKDHVVRREGFAASELERLMEATD